MTKHDEPATPSRPLPLPPSSVCIPWALARNIHTLLYRSGFFYEADELQKFIDQAARS